MNTTDQMSNSEFARYANQVIARVTVSQIAIAAQAKCSSVYLNQVLRGHRPMSDGLRGKLEPIIKDLAKSRFFKNSGQDGGPPEAA